MAKSLTLLAAIIPVLIVGYLLVQSLRPKRVPRPNRDTPDDSLASSLTDDTHLKSQTPHHVSNISRAPASPPPSAPDASPPAVPPVAPLPTTATTDLPYPLPQGLHDPVIPARLVVKPFGWSGKWHPLYHSGIANFTHMFNLEIAPANYRPKPTQLNLRFDVVEPFTVPLTFQTAKNKRQVVIAIEKQETRWYRTLTLCPYTANWVNKLINRTSRQYVFYPMDITTVPQPQEKIYDVMLASSKVSAPYLKTACDVIQKFKYVLLKKKSEGAAITPTHIAPIKQDEKLKLYAQSKTAIVWNVYTAPAPVVQGWLNVPLVLEHEAFAPAAKNMSWPMFPQLKSRTFEAAMTGTIMLALRDPFRLIEDWFDEGKEFLYWSTPEELSALITKISNNFEEYRHIGEAAQRRVLTSYSGEQWVKRYLNFLNNPDLSRKKK
eukprot:TRINITY_DN66647_c6_g1_i1.p1 TRINITY_DN66647_c6_g1~~TRINITY_DN66647_c6_g1_i1.p1  ORF type:complete len:434 (-),score=37.66 TRINITY_DN66647_c6_g1_i1:549-1850(-)